MSEDDLQREFNLLRRQVDELQTQLNEAFAMAAGANVRLDKVPTLIADLKDSIAAVHKRIDGLSLNITTIGKIDG